MLGPVAAVVGLPGELVGQPLEQVARLEVALLGRPGAARLEQQDSQVLVAAGEQVAVLGRGGDRRALLADREAVRASGERAGDA